MSNQIYTIRLCACHVPVTMLRIKSGLVATVREDRDNCVAYKDKIKLVRGIKLALDLIQFSGIKIIEPCFNF